MLEGIYNMKKLNIIAVVLLTLISLMITTENIYVDLSEKALILVSCFILTVMIGRGYIKKQSLISYIILILTSLALYILLVLFDMAMDHIIALRILDNNLYEPFPIPSVGQIITGKLEKLMSLDLIVPVIIGFIGACYSRIKTYKKLLMNVLYLIMGALLLMILPFFIFRTWGGGPFITNHIGVVTIIVFYFIVWYSYNVGIEAIKNKILLLTNSLKKKYPCKTSRVIIIALVLVFLLSMPVRWLFFYYVPKYSGGELGDISREEWENLSNTEKTRIGQSFYIEWKGSPNGLYRAGDYVNLIDEYNENGNYDNIYHIVFYSISGV